MATRQSKNFIRLFGPMKVDVSLYPAFERPSLLDLYVDGGIKHYRSKPMHLGQTIQGKWDLQAKLWIGDGDSKKMRPISFPDPLQLWLPRKKDFSDFEAALKIIPKENFALEIEAYGFLGGRRDQEWGGILSAMEYIRVNPWKKITFFGTSSQILILNPGKNSFEHRGIFSLFSFKKQKIFLNGKIDYQGHIELPGFSTRGLSNFSKGKWTLRNQHPLILMLLG